MVRLPLKAWCDALGLSFAELSRRSGVAAPAVSDYARGKRNPTLRNIEALARALEIPAWKLLKGPDPGEGLPTEEESRRANVEWFSRLPPSQRLRAAEDASRFVARARRSILKRPGARRGA